MAKSGYDNNFWPAKIESIWQTADHDRKILCRPILPIKNSDLIKAWFFQGGWFELPFFPRGHRHNPSKKDQYNPRAPSPGVRIVAFLIPKPVYISYYAIEVQSAASHLYHYIHRCEHKITTHSTMAAVCTAGKCPINTTEDRTDHNFHRSAERDFNQYPQLL